MTMAVAGSTVWMAQPVWGQELAKERADLYFLMIQSKGLILERNGKTNV